MGNDVKTKRKKSGERRRKEERRKRDPNNEMDRWTRLDQTLPQVLRQPGSHLPITYRGNPPPRHPRGKKIMIAIYSR